MKYCSKKKRNYLENQQHNIGIVGNLHGELALLLLLVLKGPMVRLIRLEFAGHAERLHLLEGSQRRELLLVVLSLTYTDAEVRNKTIKAHISLCPHGSGGY